MTGAEADSAVRLADEMNLQEILEIHYLMHLSKAGMTRSNLLNSLNWTDLHFLENCFEIT